MSNDIDWLFGGVPPRSGGGVSNDASDSGEGAEPDKVRSEGTGNPNRANGDLQFDSSGNLVTDPPEDSGVPAGPAGSDNNRDSGKEVAGAKEYDFSGATEALEKMFKQGRLGHFLRGINRNGDVQNLRDEPEPKEVVDVQGGEDLRGSSPSSGHDSGGAGVSQDDMRLLRHHHRPGRSVRQVHSMEERSAGTDPEEDEQERLQEKIADTEVVAVGLSGGYEQTSKGAFFPPTTGAHSARVEEAVKEEPWVIRRRTEIKHVFPWAEGMKAEQKEEYCEQLKGVIARMGAKSRLRSYLISIFPKHHTYIEPFGGSFKVILWKAKRSKIEIINDIDGDLIHFFRYLVFFPDELAQLINSLPTHKGLLDALRDELKRGDLNGLERAAAVYYSIKLSFNGTGAGYAGSVQSLCSARANPVEFRRVAHRLRGVDIRNQDAHDLVRSTNRRLDTLRYPGGILYYFDPPYDETAGYATLTSKSIYGKEKQFELFTLARAVHKEGNRFLMTNSSTKYLKNMWCTRKDWHYEERDVTYTISGDAEKRGKHKELIVANFPLRAKKEDGRQLTIG